MPAAKKDKALSGPEAPAALTKVQAFKYREVHRAKLLNAPYNPNVMSDYGFKLLRDKMKQVGLLNTIVWNEQTGNVVGGHHRLASLDQIEGTEDYVLGVAVINVPSRQEKELNIWLNNTSQQGAFDKEKFFRLLLDSKMDLAAAGLTKLDVELEFGELPAFMANGKSLIGNASKEDENSLVKEASALLKENESDEGDDLPPSGTKTNSKKVGRSAAVDEIAKKRREYASDGASRPDFDTDYYVILVFDNPGQKVEFLDRRGIDRSAEYATANALGFVG